MTVLRPRDNGDDKPKKKKEQPETGPRNYRRHNEFNPGERHNIEADKWDRQDLENIQNEMKSFRDAEEKLCEIATETGGALTDDTFFSLYKLKPRRVPDEEIRPTHKINGMVIDEMNGLTKFEELRQMGTIGDEISAALGFECLEEPLEEIYDKLQKAIDKAKEVEQKMRERAEAEAEARDIEDMLKDLEEPSEEDQQRMQDLQDQMDQLDQEIQDGMEEMEAEMDDKSAGVRRALNRGLGEAQEQMKNEQAAAEMFGTDPGELRNLPPEKRLAMAKALRDKPNLAKLAELVGPMTRLAATAQRRRVDYATDEVYEVELGADPLRITPEELIRFANEDTEDGFLADFAEEHLQQYKLRGLENVGKGGIIYCQDSSGSMSGEREIYATAIGLVLANMAKAQKREFKGVIFGSRSEIAVHDFLKPEDYTFEALVRYAEQFFGGGTDFEAPLSVALKHLQTQHDVTGSVNGDIVFATDGWCNVSDDFMQMFKAEQERIRFQVFGIVIGGAQSGEPLNTICDGKVITVNQIANGEPLTDIFASLNKKW